MVTGEMVEELILSGADIIKVGIGPGVRNHVHAVLGVLNPPLQGLCAQLARRQEWATLS